MRKFNCLITVAVLLVALQGCVKKEKMEQKPIDLDRMDLTVNPAEDFNLYANGNWLKNNPIPEDKSRYGNFDILGDENEKQIKSLLAEILKGKHQEGTIEQKIADFTRTGMDTVKIEEQGASVLDSEFKRINEISNLEQVQEQILYFQRNGITAPFYIYAQPDKKNSQEVVTYLYQSGLSLPDKDYYLSDVERFVNIRTKYQEYVKQIFMMLGDNDEQAQKNADEVLKIETAFAKVSMSRLMLRDPHKTYNKNTLESLKEMCPQFDWDKYFKALNLPNPGVIIVSQPEFIAEMGKMLGEFTIDQWKIFFRWHLIDASASYLSNNFVDASFNFYGKTMQGTPVNKERWKRVNSVVNSYLSQAIGKLYVKKYFPPESKERMVELIANLRLAFSERIANLEWMEDQTKANAQAKLDAITVKVGYPDKWKNYDALVIKDDAYVLNRFRCSRFEFDRMINKINKPVDKTEWHMPPQMVNAYYNPLQNEIVFPAGILQPPFFYAKGDDAVNYGAIGVVIGHEMTHGFDDKGRLYDKDGNLNTWWTEEDSKRFIAKADVLVKQFDSFVVLDTVHANGKYTLGENIADFGGLNIAYTALTKTEEWKKQEKIDNFTPAQRFFIAYATLWAQNIRDKEILRRTQEDVHSLGKYRVIGPLRNIPEFHEAFNVKETDYMYIKEEDRAKIW